MSLSWKPALEPATRPAPTSGRRGAGAAEHHQAASSLLLPRLTGHVRAAEILLLGEPIDAKQALAQGLVSRSP